MSPEAVHGRRLGEPNDGVLRRRVRQHPGCGDVRVDGREVDDAAPSQAALAVAAVVGEWLLPGHGFGDGAETEHGPGDVRLDGLGEDVGFDVRRDGAGEVSQLCRLLDEASG